jgi:hypothetical protein
VISHSFAFSASRRLEFGYKSILPCTAFPATLVSMLELSPPLPILLLPRVGGLSALSTRAVSYCWNVKEAKCDDGEKFSIRRGGACRYSLSYCLSCSLNAAL